MDKRSRNAIIISIVALAIVLITVTYAYFSARITGLESASTISLTAGRMEIVYTEGNEILSFSNIYPREEAWVTKTFTLTGWNTTEMDMSYNLGLEVETNTFPDSYLTYDLTLVSSTNGLPIQSKTGMPIIGTGIINFGRGKFTNANGDTHNYELKIYFKDNGEDQNDGQDAVFNAKISINEYIPKKGTLLTVSSYDINYNNCMTYVNGRFETQEEKQAYCNGDIVNGEPYNMDDEVAQFESDLINDNIIENVVRDGNNNITSYTINTTNCMTYVNNYYSDWTSSSKTKFCNGETINIGDDIESIQSDIDNGQLQELQNANVITNVVSSPKTTLVQGDIYVDGQYTYTYGMKPFFFKGSWLWNETDNDGWSVVLTDSLNNSGNSTEPVTTELCDSINDKPIVSMNDMFRGSKATSIDLSSFDTSHVTDMSNIFAGSQATNLDIRSFDTSNVTDMSYMFYNSQATNLDIRNFDTSNVTDMSGMFSLSQAANLDLSHFNTSKVINMSNMFFGSAATTLDLISFNTSNVTDMSRMFENTHFDTIDISHFNTSKVTNMARMFYGSEASYLNLSNLDTSSLPSSSVSATELMFAESEVESINFTNANLSNLGLHRDYSLSDESMGGSESLISNCTKIKSINFTNAIMPSNISRFWLYETLIQTLDFTNADFTQMTSMDYLFSTSAESNQLRTIILKNAKTQNVTSMANMFNSSYATTIDLSGMNTSSVKDMSNMFAHAAVIYLDLSSFDTSNVNNMEYMFIDTHLTELDLSSFDTSNVYSGKMTNLFAACTATTGYARTQADADRFNATSNKPSGLIFVVKP